MFLYKPFCPPLSFFLSFSLSFYSSLSGLIFLFYFISFYSILPISVLFSLSILFSLNSIPVSLSLSIIFYSSLSFCLSFFSSLSFCLSFYSSLSFCLSFFLFYSFTLSPSHKFIEGTYDRSSIFNIFGVPDSAKQQRLKDIFDIGHTYFVSASARL